MKNKNVIKVIVILLLYGSFSSCDLFNLNYYDEQLNLSRFKNCLDDSLWVDFPNRINSDTRLIMAYNPVVLENIFNYYSISIRQNISPIEFDNKIIELKKHAALEIREKERKNGVNKGVFFFDLKTNYSLSDIPSGVKYIVPSSLCDYDIFEGQVPADANLIVLETKFGLYNENESLKFSKLFREHGMSRGVYYIEDKKIIFYWLILW